MRADYESKEQSAFYRPALFGCLGSLVGGIGLACIVAWFLVKVGLPQGHGSGSEVADGFVIFLIPMFALRGAIVGAMLGVLIGFVTNRIRRL